MSDDDFSCPSCGARVPADAEQCELCGTSVEVDSTEAAQANPDGAGEDKKENEEGVASAEESEASGEEEAAPPERTSVYCHQCGCEHPRDANYCSQCGTALRDVSDPAQGRPVTADLPEGREEASTEAAEGGEATEERAPQAEMRSQLFWMVGIGVALVLGFFFVTQWSEQYEWGGGEQEAPSQAAAGGEAAGSGPRTSGNTAAGPSGSGGPAGGGAPAMGGSAGGGEAADLESLVSELSGSLEGPVADKIDSLRTEVDKASGSTHQQLQSELVQLYVGAGAPGRAALVQRQVAEATGTVEDRRRAADLLYQWMQKVAQQQNRAQSARVARHVASAYEAVVEKRPQDLDARTRMGEAYLLTNSPMKGIRAINGVLEDDSTFVPARFQKGLALLQISRLEEAIQQFEMVKKYADSEAPFYQQADRAVEVIRRRMSENSKNASSGS